MKKLFLIFAFVFLLAACGGSGTTEEIDFAEVEQVCLDEGGLFLSEFNECENISEATCTDLGGTFDACGSACRHEPDDVVCTQQCIQVCSFESTE